MPSLSAVVPYPTDPAVTHPGAMAPAVKLYLGDVTTPTFTLVSPSAGSTLPASSTPLVFDVKDELSLERVTGVFVAFSDANEEVAWDGVAFASAYSAGSTVSTISGGYRFSLVRSGGWKSNPTVYASARDSAGNRLSLGSATFVYAYPYDVTAPTRTLISPSAGSTLPSPSTAIVVDVKDDVALASGSTFILATFSDSPEEVVWDGTAYAAGYSGSTTSAVTGGTRYSIVRTAGWHSNPSILASARDTSGNALALASSSFVLANPRDLIAPTRTLVSPSAGSTLPAGTTALVVDVTDETALSSVRLFVTFSDSSEEVAWDGTSFAATYSGSTVSTISRGKRFTVVRTGGWRTNPSLVVNAVDTSGNELSLASSSFVYAAPPLTETTPPAVTVVSPAAGTVVLSSTPLVVDVVDIHLKSCIITVRFAGTNAPEVAFDGTGFTEGYRASELAVITNGTRFTLRRAAGWTAPPVVRVYAADSYGNEA